MSVTVRCDVCGTDHLVAHCMFCDHDLCVSHHQEFHKMIESDMEEVHNRVVDIANKALAKMKDKPVELPDNILPFRG